MPKAKTPKNLVVDGTAKLAAKSKPSDKHEAPDLNIEEATVASPRPSRKRAGDYFDFDDGADAEIPSKPAESNPAKPSKKAKIASAGKEKISTESEAKPVGTAKRGKKGKGAKDEVAESPSETITMAVEKEKRSRKPKIAKDDVAEEKPESSKKSKRATKELAADRNPKTESSTVAPDTAMDEGPFETLLESQKGQGLRNTEKESTTIPQVTKDTKTTKKSAKESKAGKTELAKASAAELAVNGADLAKKGAKAGTETMKKAANTKVPATEQATDVANVIKKGAKAGTEKVKKAANTKVPATEQATDVADFIKKGAKAGTEKVKKAANTKVPATEQAIDVADVIKKGAKAGTEKVKKAANTKVPATEQATDVADVIKKGAKAGTEKVKKAANTKVPATEQATDVADIIKKGAKAARASLGGLAASILGGTNDAAAEDVAESSGKIAANDGPGDASSEDDSDDEPDDLTTTLLAGLESDGDEGTVFGSGFQEGQDIPGLPQGESMARKLEVAKNGADEGPGVVYVGRIPHGFYEHEMRQYFSQFGDISRLRLSRSKKSGASRHFAFIEFSSAGVAKIVADTMDTYLMFGHILKCKVVPKEQVHEKLWKGANKRFKPVPWNKIEGRKLEMGLGRAQWAAKTEVEKRRRASKNEKTKEIGYEFDAGELKGVDEVPVRVIGKQIENGDTVEEEKSLVTAGGEDGNGPVVVSEEVKTKRVKMARGRMQETNTAVTKKTKRALDAGEEAVGPAVKKVKKGKNAAA